MASIDRTGGALRVMVRKHDSGVIPGTRGTPVYLHEDGSFTYGDSISLAEPPDFITSADVAAAKETLGRLKKLGAKGLA